MVSRTRKATEKHNLTPVKRKIRSVIKSKRHITKFSSTNISSKKNKISTQKIKNNSSIPVAKKTHKNDLEDLVITKLD
jgi:hypothetical protein